VEGGDIMRPIRVGVIGAGAAAEGIHLPALARTNGVETVAIADPSTDRLEHVASKFKVPSRCRSHHEAIPHIDAAIVGIPHQYHAPVTIDLLRAGVHVLVEKPMALSTAECDAMIRAAETSGARLAVGLLRRFAPTLRYTKHVVESGMLGPIRSFDVREGMIFRWPVKSAAMFSPQCGGVLADIGTHVIDLLLWWFGDIVAIDYRDDAAGGVEADAVLQVEMAGGVAGRVELSRTRDLRNSCIIRGERGTLEVGTKTDSIVTLKPVHGDASLSGRAVLPGQQPPGNLGDLFAWQMADFVRAIQTNSPPAVTGTEARRSVAILESCYRRRQRLVFPFETLQDAAASEKAS
jgi:predicted dehydrogenase